MNTWVKELKQDQTARKQFTQRCENLAVGYRITYSGLNELLDKLLRRISDLGRLQTDYNSICELLNQWRPIEKSRTFAEKEFLERFMRRFKVKIDSQVWVGNLCLDFFTASWAVSKGLGIRGFRAKGIAFEIDGPIHEFTLKNKKDRFKEKVLEELRIVVWRISNRQVYRGENLPSRSTMNVEFRSPCSRSRKRLWSKIHLMTVLYHGSDDTVRSHFPKMKTVCLEMRTT
jgi:hypothetical protein